MKKIGIGIIGLGNIGSRLYKEIISKKRDIGLKTNTNINIVAISAKNIKKKRSFKIIIGDFYSLKSASSLRNNLLNNLTDFPKNKLTIKTINSKSHILSSGPYSTINLLKNDYIKIINFGFEDLDVKLYE